jgi:hypothetical protein
VDPARTEIDVRTAAVRRAAEVVGGSSRLREILGVSALSLAVWLGGTEPPPTDVFLKAVDVIADSDLDKLRERKKQR